MSCGQSLETAGVDIGATLLAPETGGLSLDAIPVLNAGVAAANGAGLKGSLLAGGEALAGQELAGAVGIGPGNDAFNSALGITGDNPAGTGLPDIGSAFSGGADSAIGATPTGGTASGNFDLNGNMINTDTNAAGATVDTANGSTVAAPATPTAVSPASGAPVSASQSIDLSASQPTAAIGENIAGPSTAASPDLGSVGGGSSLTTPTGAASDSAIGAAGASPIGAANTNIASQFAQDAGGAPQLTASPVSTDFGGPATGTSSGGISDWLPSKGDVGKLALNAALPIGSLAYEAIKGPAKLPAQSQNLASGGAATAPLLALENQGATEAQTGTLTAPQQANILQGVQQQQNALLQQLASSGSTDPTHDSRYIAGMQQIQQWALAQQQQYITAAVSEATSAGGAASQNISTVANEQIANDTAFQNALAAAFAGLGGSIGGVKVPTTTTAAAA